MTRTRFLILPSAALLLLAACASSGASGAPVPTEGDPASSESIQPSAAPNEIPAPQGVPEDTWNAVVADLAERLDTPAPEIEVVSAGEMTWNDGSLGCPEPGQAYTQALVDGFQLVVSVDGERYDYRSAGGDSIKLCEGMIEGG